MFLVPILLNVTLFANCPHKPKMQHANIQLLIKYIFANIIYILFA